MIWTAPKLEPAIVLEADGSRAYLRWKAEFTTFISVWTIPSTRSHDFFVCNLVAVDSFGAILD